MTVSQLSVAFFLQMAVILAACRIVGAVARRFGQPQVIGEMLAGIILGPSLLGLVWPAGQAMLFPDDSLKILYVGAQLGIGLYMFLVGLELDSGVLASRLRSAASVSIAGIVVPFLLAAALAPWLLTKSGLFAEDVRPFEATLFLGASIAITALPVLARIIYERGLTGTPVGTLALAAGAINDVAAWCVLAFVLASYPPPADGGINYWNALTPLVGVVSFALLLIVIGRPMLRPLDTFASRAGHVSPTLLGVVLTLFCLSAWAMDAIGIHAVFGGFLLGTAMPRGLLANELKRMLEPITVVFMLPMFFTYSGLKTRLEIMADPEMIVVILSILAASIGGKAVACYVAARFHGEDNRTALAIGMLMNARGMMELILANIGLQTGIIQAGLFSTLVLMALVTTLMASPLFELVYGRHARLAGELALAIDADVDE